ncbi:transcriptional regulator, LacI family [Longilinea arvoryzae]|uniref:Transcriptional regulator, LacI family n=1 Tax=Longilinea arvoryzae TaxID=360412 RepID=A0A0S7BCF7_9CHLR|nr:LacI family DNA-binding transcriptional regulator [Longilinea arvoryzae]GAP15519.1 transcriptional regulator, LacI family [Longilinea arvoryzae]
MTNKTSPTIYDVARLAGVSIATVSRVLNDPHKVNEETRGVVLSAINRLGFVPKAEARARAMRSTGRIGVLTPFFTAPSFVQRLRGAAEALSRHNYELVIYTVNSSALLNTYLETLPIAHSLDGLIILSLQFSDSNAERLANQGLETVLVEYPHASLNSIEIDDIAGGRLAAEYLIQKGYTSFGFIGDTTIPEFGIHPITLRLSGFRHGLNAAGFDLSDENTLLVPYDMETTRQNGRAYLKRPGRPTAVFAATDLQATALLRAARDIGLKVPQELAILGFDDLDLADYVGLSTISQHLDESGRVAAELLLARLADPKRPVQHIQLPLTVITRETA